jgi:cytochrome d ubiquinol oxidase subunit II
MDMNFALPVIFAGIAATAILLYAILDGLDLGIGILFPFTQSEKDRTIMMNSIAPIWDGNETWLILGGGAIMAAFPKGYPALLPAFYIPIILMILSLVFRGVAFEFRFKAERKYIWNAAFCLGSIMATFFQGVILGAFISGTIQTARIAHPGGYEFIGHAWDWCTPFSIYCGLILIIGYALLGSTWVIKKSEGSLRDWAYKKAQTILLLLVIGLIGICIWTPYAAPQPIQACSGSHFYYQHF